VILKVRGALFDMDGTLVDSTAAVEVVWGEFATTHGVSPQAVIDFAHGRPSRDTIARFLPAGESVEEWNTWIADAEGGRFDDVAPIAGAVDAVRLLRPEQWAVVTSALREPALARLASVGFPRPRVLVGADDVTRGKPDPEGFARSARNLGLTPNRCVVFEDAPAGVQAGLAAGCQVVVVGALEHSVAEGLPRVADFRQVSFEQAGDGELVVRLT